MRVRFDRDVERIVAFLKEQNYPNPWTAEKLSQCLIMRIEDDDGYEAGYAWLQPHPGMERTFAVHVCIRRSHRVSWLPAFWDVEKVATMANAERLFAHFEDDRLARLVGALLIRKYGWRSIGPKTVVKDIHENM